MLPFMELQEMIKLKALTEHLWCTMYCVGTVENDIQRTCSFLIFSFQEES